MRPHPLNQTPLGVRVWRASAIGFSVTAVALNLLVPSFTSREASEAQSSPAEHARERPRAPAAPPAAAQPSGSQARTAVNNGDAALADLARRFSDAADGDLAELAGAIASLGGGSARQVLFTAARSSRPTSRVAALEALSTVDLPEVRDFMLAQLNEREPLLAAINYFADCQEPRALPALERLARDASAELRSAVVASLYAQGESATAVIARLLQADDELSDALLEAAPTSATARTLLRRASIQRLRAGAITQGRVFDFLEQDLSSEAREALLDAAHDPASAGRALGALSRRGDRASLTALERLTRDFDRGLAAQATCALRTETGARGQRAQLRFSQ